MADEGDNFLRYEATPEQEQAELTAAAAPLTAFFFPATIFSRNAAIDAGFSFKTFLKYVKTVARYNDGNLLESVVSLGAKRSIFTAHETCNLKQFVALARFLNSKEGQEAMIGVRKIQKLVQRARGRFEPRDLAFASLLEMQRQDYNRARKYETSEYDKELNKLRLEIRKVEARKEARLREIDAAYLPVSAQPDMPEEEMKII